MLLKQNHPSVSVASLFSATEMQIPPREQPSAGAVSRSARQKALPLRSFQVSLFPLQPRAWEYGD